MCDQLRKRNVDMCCLQEERWRRQGAQSVGIRGRKHKLWWCGKNNGIGIRILVKNFAKSHRNLKKKQQSDGNGAGFRE